MKNAHRRLPDAAGPLLLLSLALATGSSLGGTDKARTNVQQRFEQEHAACLSGNSPQDRPTCLREAGAARAEARADARADTRTAGRRDTQTGDAARYAGNQLRRCEALPADDRTACVARMKGQGTTTGSVAGGGIYRELVTRELAASEPVR